MMRIWIANAALVAAMMASGCGDAGKVEREPVEQPAENDLTGTLLSNPSAYIPPQCYTRTRDDQGRVHNPCYVCHSGPDRPNFIDDAALQLDYDFAAPAFENRWNNLFVDRRAAVAAMSDAEILAYVRTDNYRGGDGRIAIAGRLADLPAGWDHDGDGQWQGFVPDAYFDFDARGFDREPQGALTGWRAYSYYPFPGTFWPTNGSAGDALIRLPEEYRVAEDGTPDLDVYVVNLAIVEAMAKERDVALEAPVDEVALGVDLDRDGALGQASTIAFRWAPLKDVHMDYVGRAGARARAGALPRPTAGLLPPGTEILHSVRYLDIDGQAVSMARRMKELRYMRKTTWQTYSDLEQAAAEEDLEKQQFPDRLRQPVGNVEIGVYTGTGWRMQGFIEDAGGQLRPQTFEETVFCIGCHGGVGANVDSTFSLARKLDADGWQHARSLAGMPEPLRADGTPEYAHYLAHNGAGDELRGNDEVLARFFGVDGRPQPEALARLRGDIGTLLLPSPGRAMTLNKAYRVIVREQSFARGRDATVAPAEHVHRVIEPGEDTGVVDPVPGSGMLQARAAR